MRDQLIARRTALAVAMLAFADSPAAGQAVTGAARVEGAVVNSTGVAIRDAVVSFVRIPQTRKVVSRFGQRFERLPGEARISKSQAAGSDGAFQLLTLPRGEYVLCAEAPGYLDNCRWTRAVQRTLATDNERASGVAIVLEPGATIEVELADPLGLLPKPSPLFGPGYSIGIFTSKGAFYGMSIVSEGAASKLLRITVPFDADLTLWLFSRHVGFQNEGGQVLNSGGTRIPLRVPRGITLQRSRFQVTKLP